MPAELRRDVRTLGSLLGRVISGDGGPDLLADVEHLRQTLIRARSGEIADPLPDLQAFVDGLALTRCEQVARAFTCYFHLVNLAEEHHRVRSLREHPPTRGTIASALATVDDPERALARLRIHPVLTAHPTEARRRAIVTAVRRIGVLLDGARDERRLLEEIEILWRSGQLRNDRPGPVDEVRGAMAVFDETIFRTIPRLYRHVEDQLGEHLGPPRTPAFVRLGSWIGGDRDGNPSVTAAISREAIEIQSEHVLLALEAAARRIGRMLSADRESTPPSAELQQLLDDAAALQPRPLAAITSRGPDQPHRHAVMLTAERIAATRERDADLAYGSPHELLADLAVVQRSLVHAGAPRLAYGELQHLVWQVQTFGFHLAELEIRQHSQVHERALAELRAGGVRSAETVEVLATVRAMAALQQRFGPESCRRYVVSFTRTAADIAAVHELAEFALSGRQLVLDVVPLFETGDDIARATTVLSEAIELPAVSRRLRENGRELEVMLGYSDSAKDVGPVSAALALSRAQADLASWAAKNAIDLLLFHGRGGSLGRGGGPANRAILAQAPGSVAGRFKVTEQGEVIHARYGTAEIALRHLDQVGDAVLRASTPAADAHTHLISERFAQLGRTIDVAARQSYHDLVRCDGFAEWFARISPLDELGAMRLGSRPARRGQTRALSELRAIPWVFAWSQTRLNLPGWYGLGSGLAAVEDLDLLRAAYADWPLFATIIENAEMSLAKSDRGIAARYLALAERPELAERILDERARSIEQVLAVTGHHELLDGRRVLGRAVDLREPYVDALSLVQLRALSALRRGDADGDEQARNEHLLLLTAGGIAAGLQNTG